MFLEQTTKKLLINFTTKTKRSSNREIRVKLSISLFLKWVIQAYFLGRHFSCSPDAKSANLSFDNVKSLTTSIQFSLRKLYCLVFIFIPEICTGFNFIYMSSTSLKKNIFVRLLKAIISWSWKRKVIIVMWYLFSCWLQVRICNRMFRFYSKRAYVCKNDNPWNDPNFLRKAWLKHVNS